MITCFVLFACALSAPGLADQTLDGFETGNLDAYTGATDAFTISDAVARSGTYALKYEHEKTTSPLDVASDRGRRRFTRGQTLVCHFYVDARTDPDNLVAGLRFASDGTPANSYNAYYAGTSDELRIGKTKNGDFSVLARASFNSNLVPTDQWTRLIVQWADAGGIYFTWENAAGEKLTGACARDDDFADHAGVGVTTNARHQTPRLFYFDDVRILSHHEQHPLYPDQNNEAPPNTRGSDIHITHPVDGKTYDTIVRTLEFEAAGDFDAFHFEADNVHDARWQPIDRRKASPTEPISGLVSGTGKVTFRIIGTRPDGTTVTDSATVTVRCSENGIDKIDPVLWQTNPYQLIHVNDQQQLDTTRRSIIKAVYKKNGRLPTRTGEVQKDVDEVPSLPMNRVDNWSRIDEVAVKSELETTSYVYHVRSSVKDNNALFIHKAGHAGDHSEGGRKTLTQEMIDRGYDVLLVGMYARNFNRAKFNHNDLRGRHPPNFNPMKLFHDHIAVGLNYALEQHDYDQVFMTGKSGGGWSTVTYGAMDKRINRVYPIAGTQPIYIHEYEEQHGHHSWDYEQGNDSRYTRDFYEKFTYLDHYVIATAGAGRGGIFVSVRRDDCCFYGVNHRITEEVMKTHLASHFDDAESFDWYIDDSVDSHRISADVVELILDDADRYVE